MCHDGISATCYCSKHSLCQRSLQHFCHLQDTLDQAMGHSRGSVCKDFSEIKVQITSKGTLIRPVELTARLINYLQVFWSLLKHFLFQLYLNFDVFVLPGVQLSVFLVPNMVGSSYSSCCVSDRNGELWEEHSYLSLAIILLLISVKGFCLLPAEENKWALP